MSEQNAIRLRLASWNVHSCKGMDRRTDPDRTLAVIDALDADVIALQEVPTQSRHPALRALLDGDRGYHSLVETTLPDHADGFGNALLSRQPLQAAGRIDLGVSGRENRCAIQAKVAFESGGALHVIATHLGLNQRERREQLDRIQAHLNQATHACVVLGDFNTWLRWPAGELASLRDGQKLRYPRSFPAAAPLLRLDRILVSPPLSLSALRTWHAPGLRLASDHLPVVADVALPADA